MERAVRGVTEPPCAGGRRRGRRSRRRVYGNQEPTFCHRQRRKPARYIVVVRGEGGFFSLAIFSASNILDPDSQAYILPPCRHGPGLRSVGVSVVVTTVSCLLEPAAAAAAAAAKGSVCACRSASVRVYLSFSSHPVQRARDTSSGDANRRRRLSADIRPDLYFATPHAISGSSSSDFTRTPAFRLLVAMDHWGGFRRNLRHATELEFWHKVPSFPRLIFLCLRLSSLMIYDAYRITRGLLERSHFSFKPCWKPSVIFHSSFTFLSCGTFIESSFVTAR